MRRQVLYFSSKCPDTKSFIEVLNQMTKDYQAVDITENLNNLSEFLNHRDHHPEFHSKKITNQVGVPVLVIDEKDFLFDPSELSAYFNHKE